MKFTKRIILIMLFFISAFMFGSFMKNSKVNAEGEVCEIVETGVKYATFSAAKTAAASGQTIKLLADINTDANVSISKDLAIDFGDYTYTCTNTYAFSFSSTAYSITFKASGSGGFASTKNLIYFPGTIPGGARVYILSGTYNKINMYGVGKSYLSSDSLISAISDKVIIRGGTFFLSQEQARNNLATLVDSRYLKVSSDIDASNFKLEVKSSSYIENEDTKASANITYEPSYYVYRKVTSLSSSDAGKKYLIAYVNESEDVVQIMKNFANGSEHLMAADNHYKVNETNDGTWYINSNSEFKGDPNEDYFVTLGWAGNGYTFTVKAGIYNYKLYYKSADNYFEPHDDTYMGNASYSYVFGFSDVDDYFYPLNATSSCISYTPKAALQHKNYFRIIGTNYESGAESDGRTVRAHLFEAVKIDPVVNASSIRFGTGITKDMYDFLSSAGTSVSFGVIAKGTTALGGAELTYDNASIKKTITPARVASIGAAVEDLEGDYYQFALVLDGITEATYNKSITARVYVCVDGEYYYMNESVYSLQTLAAAYFNAADTSAYTEHLDVLEYLKDYAG